MQFGQKGVTFPSGVRGRNIACTVRKMDSSSALESSGSLLSNAPSLAIIRAVLAMIHHERSASKTKNFRVQHIAKTKDNHHNIKGISKECQGET